MKRWHPLNWIQWLTLALALFVAFAVIVLYLRITHVQQHQNDALRSIICRAEHVVKTEPGLTVTQRQGALKFYEDALTGAHLKSCE